MKIGTFVASLVFLSCFNVNESQKHHTLLQARMEVRLGTCCDKQLVQPQWSDIPAINWLVRYAICTLHMVYVLYPSKADRNGL
jgi:hypothetical protein